MIRGAIDWIVGNVLQPCWTLTWLREHQTAEHDEAHGWSSYEHSRCHTTFESVKRLREVNPPGAVLCPKFPTQAIQKRS